MNNDLLEGNCSYTYPELNAMGITVIDSNNKYRGIYCYNDKYMRFYTVLQGTSKYRIRLNNPINSYVIDNYFPILFCCGISHYMCLLGMYSLIIAITDKSGDYYHGAQGVIDIPYGIEKDNFYTVKIVKLDSETFEEVQHKYFGFNFENYAAISDNPFVKVIEHQRDYYPVLADLFTETAYRNNPIRNVITPNIPPMFDYLRLVTDISQEKSELIANMKEK